MPFFADVMNSGLYILIEYDGKLSRAEIEAGRSCLLELVQSSGCRRVLIDFSSVPSRKSTEDVYSYAESFKSFPSGIKVGLVIPTEQLWCAEFIEKLATNRGLNLKTFVAHEKAKAWLLHVSETADSAGGRRAMGLQACRRSPK